jgi:hypothetical protein
MQSPLVVDTTGEIRRQLAAAQAALSQLEALLSPMPTDNQRPARPKGGGKR